MTANGAWLPTWALPRLGSNLGYTVRDLNVVAQVWPRSSGSCVGSVELEADASRVISLQWNEDIEDDRLDRFVTFCHYTQLGIIRSVRPQGQSPHPGQQRRKRPLAKSSSTVNLPSFTSQGRTR
jgi:hypothetical protein